MKDKRFLKSGAPADSILKNTNIVEGNETFYLRKVSGFFFFLLKEGQFLSYHFLRWFLTAISRNRFISSSCMCFKYFFLVIEGDSACWNAILMSSVKIQWNRLFFNLPWKKEKGSVVCTFAFTIEDLLLLNRILISQHKNCLFLFQPE